MKWVPVIVTGIYRCQAVTWWRHQIEIISALLAICAGNSPASSEFPAQRPVTRSFDVFFDLYLNKRLRNNREAGDLRRYGAHYDVIVMTRINLFTDIFVIWDTVEIYMKYTNTIFCDKLTIASCVKWRQYSGFNVFNTLRPSFSKRIFKVKVKVKNHFIVIITWV